MKTTILIRYAILIVVATLALISCTANQGSLAGRINGEPIPQIEYVASHRAHYENFSFANNRSPSIDEKQEIARLTWRDITKHVILQQQFRRYKITSSISETLDTLKANPPSYILKSPVFQSNGVFDPALYQQSLLYGQPEDLSPVVKQYRDYYVPIAKLKEKLIADRINSPNAKKINDKVINSVADIDLIYIDSSQTKVVVREDEIRLYYETHKADFALTPHYSLAYAILPLNASQADINATNDFAQNMYQMLVTGAKPDTLSTWAQKQNMFCRWQEKGFLKIQDLDAKFAAELTNLENGEYLPPVTQTDGVAIHRLDQKTKSMLSYSTLFLPYLPGEKTIDLDKGRALQSAKLLGSFPYEVAADELDLHFELKNNIGLGTSWLDSSFQTPDLKQGQKLKVDYVPEPVFYPPKSGWLLIKITQSQMEPYKTLAEVKQEIGNHLVAQNRQQFALSDAKTWLLNGTLDDLSRLPSAQKKQLKDQSLISSTDPMFSSEILYQAMFRHYQGEKPTAYLKGDYVLIPLLKNIRKDTQIKLNSRQLRQLYQQALPTDWFNVWMEEQIKKAKVKIFIEL